MGKRDALPAIRKLLHHEYGEVRKEACAALALLEGPQALQDVMAVFKDPEVSPTSALIRLSARDALPELSKRLTRFNLDLVEAIVELGGREALPRIFAILDKPEKNYDYSQGLRAVARAYPKESIASLRINLACKIHNNPVSAAAMLCEAGSTEGIPLLLENQRPTFSLNAVRRPEAWQTLHDCRIDQTLYGTGQELLTRIARETGLKVEGLPADAPAFKAWTGHHYFLPKDHRPLRLIEIVERLEDQRWGFILEKDAIRVVSGDAALAFWKEWSSPAQEK